MTKEIAGGHTRGGFKLGRRGCDRREPLGTKSIGTSRVAKTAVILKSFIILVILVIHDGYRSRCKRMEAFPRTVLNFKPMIGNHDRIVGRPKSDDGN